MPSARRPASNPRKKLLVSLALSLLLAGLAVTLVLLRGRPGPPAAGSELSRGPAATETPDDAGTVAPKAARLDAAAAPPEQEEAAETAAPGAPPLLAGRVTGEGAGIEGATVLLFATRKVEEIIEHLEALAPEAGELPDIPAIAAKIREELEGFRAAALSARSGRDGEYAFRSIAPGGYLVLTLAESWLFRYGDVVSLEEGATRTLDIALDRGGSISGRVLRASGDGVPGATVIAEPRPMGMAGLGLIVRRLLRYLNGEFLRGPFIAPTAPDGSFTLASLPPGVYDIAAATDDGVEGRLPQVETGTTEAVVYLGEPAVLRGRFADAAGSPAAGVALRLERLDDLVQPLFPMGGFDKVANSVSRWLGDGSKKTVSGRKGELEVRGLAAGRWRLAVEERGFEPFSRDVDLDWGEVVDLGLLKLDRGEVISGTVRGPDGAPIAGAKVFASPAKPNILGMGAVVNDFLTSRTTAHTGAGGDFRLAGLAKGRYKLIASAAGFAPGVKAGAEAGGEPVTIDLAPGRTVTGRVVTAGGGEPIAGAKVQAGEARGRTDAEGRFRLEGVAPRDRRLDPFSGGGGPRPEGGEEERPRVRLKASAPGFVEKKEELDLEAASLEVTIQLSRAPEIRGIVLDPEGKPAPGSLVRLVPAIPEDIPLPFDFFDRGMVFLAVGVADLEGRFRFQRFRADEETRFQVRADRLGHARGLSEPFAVLDLAPPDEESKPAREPDDDGIRVQLVRAASVKGVVTDGSAPVAGAGVRLAKAPRKQKGPGEQAAFFFGLLGLPKRGDVVPTDREGRFEHAQILPGDYEVSAEKQGFTESPAQLVTLAPGEEREVTLVVDPGGEVSGLVLIPTGEPLAGARLRLLREAGDDEQEKQRFGIQKLFGGAYKSARSGDDGSFRFQGLPAASYVLLAEHPGCVKREVPGVKPGGDPQRIVLEPAASLAGSVADAATGAPIPRFRVKIQKEGEEPKGTPEDMRFGDREHADAEGIFVERDLEPGRYTVKVSAQGYSPARVELVLTSGSVAEERFLLAQAGRARGLVTDLATGRPVAGARVRISKAPRREPRGAARTEEVEAGQEGRPQGGAEEAGARRKERLEARRAEREGRGGGNLEREGAQPEGDDRKALGEHFAEEWMDPDAVLTREDGTFLLEDVPEGLQTVVVSHAEYLPAARDGVEAAPGQEVEVGFALRSGLSVSGKVLDGAGNAVPGRIVFARGGSEGVRLTRSTMSVAAGEFRIAGLEKGTYRLSVSGQGDAGSWPEPQDMDVTEDRSGVELRVPAGQ
ncbi:MAG: carboxypeptidase regulatory-like domain-containing protein [Planctomycetes bacterium]|nr:carboxypeptidase regulatory-like domain-containing protein [Planctomycetota bacterium]